MRWASWLLGIAGVVQYGIIAYLQPTDYVSADMAYLVMWLAAIGALLLCYLSCWGGGCCCDDGSCEDGSCGCGHGPSASCDCCDDHCHCGDCDACDPDNHGHGDGNGKATHAH